MENNKPKQSKPPKNEGWKKEKLSKEDLEDLMGIHTPTYRRVNGRIKRRG